MDMNPGVSGELSNLAIHTVTNKPWTLEQCVSAYAKAGIGGISVWRDKLAPMGAQAAGQMIRDAGLFVPALVRGGFFVSADRAKRQAAIEDNMRAIDEAALLAAEQVVLVVGAEPGIALHDARALVVEGIAQVMDHAEASGVKLAIEPLHPMYAAERSCINRMSEARQVCEALQNPAVGIAVDVYHVWWDPELQWEIDVAGEQDTLFGFHVCDWRVPTRDMLTDRGLMGEGIIDIRGIKKMMENSQFRGMTEVEIFSEEYWAMDQDVYLQQIIAAYLEHVA